MGRLWIKQMLCNLQSIKDELPDDTIFRRKSEGERIKAAETVECLE